MGLVAEVRGADGQRVTLDDPSGGTFDAAGDFDRLIPADSPDLPALSALDPYGEWTVPFDRLSDLAAEVASVRRDARPGPEEHGLDRLSALISACLTQEDLVVVFAGD